MKLTKLHRLDFRWVIAALPAVIILAGLGSESFSSELFNQQGLNSQFGQEFTVTSNEEGDQSRNSQSLTGMAGESQPATIPRASWTAASYCSGKDQSRKNRFPVGSALAFERNDLVSMSPLSERTSLGRVSGRLCRLYTLIGLKPSGTS